MATEIEIRELRPGDLDLLGQVAPGVFDSPIDEVRTREFLADPRHHLVIALAAGNVVGFISVVDYVHPDKPQPELWINEVGVAPSHRGVGIGKRMLAAVLKIAEQLGCAEAWVTTDRTNAAARRLYASLGGEESNLDEIQYKFHLPSISVAS